MIVNTLRKCCENCSYIEASVDTEIHENCIGDSHVVSVIYCYHREVCKPYIEEMQKEAEG